MHEEEEEKEEKEHERGEEKGNLRQKDGKEREWKVGVWGQLSHLQQYGGLRSMLVGGVHHLTDSRRNDQLASVHA